MPKLSQIAFSKILPVSSVFRGVGVGSVIARIVSRIFCTNTFTSVSADRVSAAAVVAAAAYKTDVIDGMEWNTVHLLLPRFNISIFCNIH